MSKKTETTRKYIVQGLYIETIKIDKGKDVIKEYKKGDVIELTEAVAKAPGNRNKFKVFGASFDNSAECKSLKKSLSDKEKEIEKLKKQLSSATEETLPTQNL